MSMFFDLKSLYFKNRVNTYELQLQYEEHLQIFRFSYDHVCDT